MKKTESMTTDPPNEPGTICMNDIDLPCAQTFRHLGLTSDGSLRHEITAQINEAWSKWCMMTGVLCDKVWPVALTPPLEENNLMSVFHIWTWDPLSLQILYLILEGPFIFLEK
ncbi:hypothetical protein JRQ81_015532 [Phrynocephalus forsythii]|uniref:Uncharacterized protein n=1 Tax=Phrynocephalus forsythii TaxID=171643 RepID=A0A9Q1B243_9SAUR|nr:hypothetical protein JRQ81_015532 [Phrynocephalus forsythii]